ncbi:hypothetical protein [Nocardioides sp. W7]|uniref:hypothetical protein n=1 Tax=Nocardioides sp. W7 TaxID=2931390 RepID=UPI001FD0367D|nr:hypothetical protein [Nocardioides sp. W7]
MRVPDRALALLVAVPFVVGFTAAPADAGAEVAFTFADPEIVESSGLATLDGLVATVNDSGDSGRVFAVDPASGETVGVTRWSPEPRDVEAVAPAGPGEVWVGDIGDNRGVRESVEVLRVPVRRGDRTVEPERFELVYPDGATDAETLMTEPGSGRLVVVSKGIFGGVVYRAPARLDPDEPNRLEEVGTAIGLATDGAFFPDGRHLVVRNYGRAAVLTWPRLEEVGSFDLPDQDQGEGLAVDEDGQLLVGTEGAFSEVLRVSLPGEFQAAMAATPSPSAETSPLPADTVEPDDGYDGPGDGSDPQWGWLVAGLLVIVLPLLGVALLVLVVVSAVRGRRR